MNESDGIRFILLYLLVTGIFPLTISIHWINLLILKKWKS